VLHEFTSIPGVKEDVTDIILNLKQLRLKLHEGESDVIRIDVSGEKVVTGRDLVTSEKLEVLNPDLHICTVGGEGKLKMELAVRMGKGYVPAEQNKREGDPVGTIPIDSTHTPIVRCNRSARSPPSRRASSSCSSRAPSCFTSLEGPKR
jgi:DNA-directed RNA polymerase subunit alpha